MTNTAKSTFTLRPFGGADVKRDYELIHRLANCQVPQDPKGNLEWLQYRRRYDDVTGKRRHYIAIHKATQESVGYAAIEQQRQDNPTEYRLYLVFDSKQWAFSNLGEFMYQYLLSDARELGATKVVMLEYADDLPFINFLSEHDFIHVGVMTYNGFEVARLEKKL